MSGLHIIEGAISEMKNGSGVFTISPLIGNEECCELREIITSYEPDEYGGIRCLLDKSPIFERVVTHDIFWNICTSLFKVEFRLAAFGARIIPPAGTIDQKQERIASAHIDHPYREVISTNEGKDSRYYDIPLGLQVLIPLIDLDLETGATGYIPGSHKWYRHASQDEFLRRFNSGEVKRLVVPQGSASMWSGPVWHSAFPNKSDKQRIMMTFLFSPAFVKQPHLMREIYSKEFILSGSQRLQTLLGANDLYPMTFSQPQKVKKHAQI